MTTDYTATDRTFFAEHPEQTTCIRRVLPDEPFTERDIPCTRRGHRPLGCRRDGLVVVGRWRDGSRVRFLLHTPRAVLNTEGIAVGSWDWEVDRPDGIDRFIERMNGREWLASSFVIAYAVDSA